jgi:hypothetical protein
MNTEQMKRLAAKLTQLRPADGKGDVIIGRCHPMRVDALEVCLRIAVDMLEPEDVVATYDAAAERFHRATGHMAPGKSIPLAMNDTLDDDTRRKIWADFRSAEKRMVVAAMRALLDGWESA